MDYDRFNIFDVVSNNPRIEPQEYFCKQCPHFELFGDTPSCYIALEQHWPQGCNGGDSRQHYQRFVPAIMNYIPKECPFILEHALDQRPHNDEWISVRNKYATLLTMEFSGDPDEDHYWND